MRNCLKCNGPPSIFRFDTPPPFTKPRYFVICLGCGFHTNRHHVSEDRAKEAWDEFWNSVIDEGLTCTVDEDFGV